MTKLALFHGQTQDSFHSGHVLLLPELSRVRGKLDPLLYVNFVHISDDTRIDVLHIIPTGRFRVLTHTLCILPSESISLGLPRHHHQV